ncbi:MAG TPA: FtsX-like permease family protein [Casimicrobiaceae bacterium]|nr:FtsX-like permease family protein [Casimicrobiaceae bacterium]
MKAIDRKLLRDLWLMRSQILTVALVVGSAFAGFAGSLATYESLVEARESFYDSARFAHVFADLKRAPRALERRLAEIPGVSDAEATVVFDATLDVPGVAAPVIGRMIGVSAGEPARLDRLVIRRGRAPQFGRTGEAVVSEGFANVHGLAPGDSVGVLLNGRHETLSIVGIGLSPDYIFATQGGAFPDDRNFGVFWVDRERLATAYDMEGAFNHVALRLAPGASERAAIAALDTLLEPYGGLTAHGRDEQPSHRILAQEIDQWKVIGTVIPTIFLVVAAFLLNVVVGRQVATQREQIAVLKALGYANGALVRHYLLQVAAVVALGIVLGTGAGIWFGTAVTALYAEFFHFPSYRFVLPPWVALAAATVTLGAAVGGTLGAVRHAVSIAPAEAMRPPFPGRYRPTLMERAGLGRLLTPAMRMTVRNMERRAGRALLTTAGIAAAMAIVICGMFWRDALDYMIDVQFVAAQRADAEIALTEASGLRAVREIARLPGVTLAEGGRDVAVRLVAGHRSYRTAVVGIARDSELRRPLDADLRPIAIPAEGMLLTDRLAERLEVRPGDSLRVEVLTGERRHLDVPVAGTVRDLIGLFAYMDRAALSRLAGDGDTVSSVSAKLDGGGGEALFARLKAFPRIAVAASKTAMLANFRETSARNVLFFTAVLTGFAAMIAIGVVYNHARIALQERTWELASLRVLGFTRGEVSTFLLGELALEIAAALPLGGVLGYMLSWTIVRMSHTDMIAIPIVIAPRTYAFAALAIVAAGVASALIVRRRIDRLDLVGALKTRE